MKNIINFKKSIIFALTIFMSFSCTDYLRDELLSDTSVSSLYDNIDGLESATVGLYSLNRKLYENRSQNGATPLILQSLSDLSFSRSGEISLYGRLHWGSTVSSYGTRSGLNYYWTHYYKLVDRANSIIDGAEKLEDSDRKSEVLAQAKCMRAHSYFTLYRLFNNIYIKTEPTTPENAFDKPSKNSSEDEIFTLLKSDLDYAIANLEWSSDFGRWNQGAARHLRAKVAAWQKDWAEASKQTDAVIGSGVYALESSTKDVFKGSLGQNETLFAIQFEHDVIGGGSKNYMNWQTVASYASSPGVVKSDENGGSGAGFLTLNKYIIDLLKKDPNDDRLKSTYYIGEYKFNDPKTLPEGKKLGDVVDLYDVNSSDKNEFKKYYQRMNPGVLKFRDETAEPTDRSHIKNIMVYRLAETYLLGAEAHMMNGNSGKAMEYINAVRTRANAAPESAVDIETILDERARELAFEGQRWFTLKRLGLLYEYRQDHMGNDNYNQLYRSGDPRVKVKDYMKNWPIPQKQLDLLGDSYPQNIGY